MTFEPTVFEDQTNPLAGEDDAPRLNAEELNKLGSQYGVVLNEITDGAGPISAALDAAYLTVGSARTLRDAQIVDLANRSPSGREHLLASKLPGPIMVLADQAAESIYWPMLVDLSVSGDPGYMLLYSTDHAATHSHSGIFAAWLPTPLADKSEWTFFGRIWRDDVVGTQTETPTLIWNEVTGLWHLYYQQKAGSNSTQATLLATCSQSQLAALVSDSTPITWTRIGVVIDAPSSTSVIPGDVIHHGYLTVWRFGAEWIGTTVGGGTYGGFDGWSSLDGIAWTRSGTSRKSQGGVHIAHLVGFDPATWVLKWTWSNIIDWRGRLQILAAIGQEAAGEEEPGSFRLATAPMSPDRRSPASKFIDVTPPIQEWETISSMDTIGQGASYLGKFYIPFRSNLKTGGFGLLEVS